MVRPSYVLGGRGMEVVTTRRCWPATWPRPWAFPERPILIDKFLDNAIEAEADAIADGPMPLCRRSWSISNWPASTPAIRPA
jgi:carbamoyl-phosphate synthase large subunit